MGRFRSNFWRRIRIRNQNQLITSGFWDIWGYVLEKWGFSYFWGYVQDTRNFFVFFLKCHHLGLLFSFKISYWTVTSDFFSQRYGHIKFCHLSEQPYERSHWLFGAPFCIRKFILKIWACGFWWTVNKNLQSENWHFHF